MTCDINVLFFLWDLAMKNSSRIRSSLMFKFRPQDFVDYFVLFSSVWVKLKIRSKFYKNQTAVFLILDVVNVVNNLRRELYDKTFSFILDILTFSIQLTWFPTTGNMSQQWKAKYSVKLFNSMTSLETIMKVLSHLRIRE